MMPSDLVVRAERAEAGSLVSGSLAGPRELAIRLGLSCFVETVPAKEAPSGIGMATGISVPIVGSFISAVDALSLNRVVGLGVSAPATEAQLDRVLDFARAAGIPKLMLQVVPGAQPTALLEWIAARGGTPHHRWVRLWRHTAEPLPAASPTDLRIGELRAGGGHRDADAFGEVIRAAFSMPHAVAPWLAATVGHVGWRHFGAWDGDKLIGGAALFVAAGGVPGLRTGWLGMAGTLARYRGRGAQGALIRERVRLAAELGCDLVVTETAEQSEEDPGPSYRNMRRMGFAEGYRRQNYAIQPTESV
jgi:GNAT superfamily N-acetyltransferase